MKACKHYFFIFKSMYKVDVDEIEILSGATKQYNAWVVFLRKGKPIIQRYHPKLMIEYLRHLKISWKCCDEIGWSFDDVLKRLKLIEIQNQYNVKNTPPLDLIIG